MIEVTVCKADPIGTDAAPDTHIHITGKLPESKGPIESLPEFLAASAKVFDSQAEAIEVALHDSLPGGTYDRLLGRMLARKATHFRVAFDVAEAPNARA
jgi:hypothetical protein